jgi:hypothetical protein
MYKTGKPIKSILYRIGEIEIPESERCVICFEKAEKEYILIPCGHIQYCNVCINKIRECALCRSAIENKVKIIK